jgi:PAS domain S-box-containing protein
MQHKHIANSSEPTIAKLTLFSITTNPKILYSLYNIRKEFKNDNDFIKTLRKNIIEQTIPAHWQKHINVLAHEIGKIAGLTFSQRLAPSLRNKLMAKIALILITAKSLNVLIKIGSYFQRNFVVTHGDADIVFIDTLGNIIWGNKKTLSTLGYSQKEIQSIGGLDIVHPDDHMVLLENLSKQLTNNDFSPYEIRAISKNGNVRDVQVSPMPFPKNFTGKYICGTVVHTGDNK